MSFAWGADSIRRKASIIPSCGNFFMTTPFVGYAADATCSRPNTRSASEPKDQFYGVEAVFKDPFGNWFSLTQPKNY